MTLTAGQREEAAWLLRRAEHRVRPSDPLSALLPGLDPADAYAVQQSGLARRPTDGASVVRHEVGLTSAAMRRLLGVDEPDHGRLPDDMTHCDGATVLAARYRAPRVEPETCFRPARPPRGPGVTVADVLDATEAVAPAREIADSRVRDCRITPADTIADNAGSAGLVRGPWTPPRHAPDLASVTADLFLDGERVASGAGHEVLGGPARAVPPPRWPGRPTPSPLPVRPCGPAGRSCPAP
ncbi:2-keto-4-pentenoate hydratase [Streptomyces sp. YKOK-I1]